MILKSAFPDIIIPEISFTEFAFKSLYARGDDIAIIDVPTGRELSYRQIADSATKCAGTLCKRGLRKGDMVAICANNSPEYAIALLACAACGAAITTCNPNYTIHEITKQFSNSEPKIVFTVPSIYDKIKLVAESVCCIKNIYTIGSHPGVESFDSLISGDNGQHYPRHVCIEPREDVLLLPYSSGTTGLPKGVMVTHYAFIANIILNRMKPAFNSDCFYHVLPIFHVYGLKIIFQAFDQGVKLVLDRRFDVQDTFETIEKYKVTKFFCVPPMLLAMAKSPYIDHYNLSSLKTIGCGAAPLSPKIGDIIRRKLHVYITQGWGLTEFLPIAYVDLLCTPADSAGCVCSNTMLKVIDTNTGAVLGPYQQGELCVKGPQMMKGYYKNSQATACMIDVDGWLHTGDIGYYDSNEMIFIVDRLKELIKYKGFQVPPAEVEAVLLGHPGVADAAVIGIPDVETGELAKAFIVKKDPYLTKDQIQEHIQGKLSKYKHLHGGIDFRNMIEKTPSGKILRRVLRQQNTKAAL